MTTTAALVGALNPQSVQIVVSATDDGVPWTVTGSAGGFEWTVPGGSGIGDGEQLVLADNRGPLNVPITYTYTSSTTEAAAPVTRVASSDIVLQTLDGQKSVGANLMYGSQDTQLEVRQAVFSIPGRRRPVVRYTDTGAGGGRLLIRVDIAESAAFDDLLAAGAPLIWLMGGTTFDMSPVAPIAVTQASSAGIPEIEMREWSLSYLLIDDPYLDTRLGVFSWDDFDTAMATPDAWDDFDTAFASATWNEFDTQDWTLL